MATYVVTKYHDARMIVSGTECVGYDLGPVEWQPQVVGRFPDFDAAEAFVRAHGAHFVQKFDATWQFRAAGAWNYDIRRHRQTWR